MVKFDDLDISIISFVADHPNSTVTDCAKSLFNPQNTEDLQKKDSMLRHRFKALSSDRDGLVVDSDGSRLIWTQQWHSKR